MMKEKFVPLDKQILVKSVSTWNKEDRKLYRACDVLECGENVTLIKVGDTIFFDRSKGTRLGDAHFSIDEPDVLGFVTEVVYIQKNELYYKGYPIDEHKFNGKTVLDNQHECMQFNKIEKKNE